MKSKFRVIWGVLLFLASLACRPGGAADAPGDSQAAEGEAWAVEKVYERGPVRFFLKVDKQEITIAEKIYLVLEAETHNRYEVAFPELGEELAQFTIRDIDLPPPEVLDEETLRLRYAYELEPFLSGDYTIPPLTFRYWTEEDSEDNAHLLETEAVEITVRSILPEEMENLTLRDIVNPLPPPPADLTWLWILLAALAAGGGGLTLLVIWLVRRNRGGVESVYTPAHEIAFRQLRRLVESDYIEKQEYKLFYNGISNILRHYIENRFGLQAPESTTEEFLDSLQNSSQLDEARKKLLREFLEHCDLVKFAELMPSREQVQRTFDICKSFILETQAKEVTVVDTGDTFRPEGGPESGAAEPEFSPAAGGEEFVAVPPDPAEPDPSILKIQQGEEND